MALTDFALKAIRPSDKTRRLFDGGGLYLEVTAAGSKYWRWKYRYALREKRLALGVYPEVSLRLARERRDEARRLLASGVDPGAARKAQRAVLATTTGNTFEVLGREWFETHKASWVPAHADKVWHRIEKNLLPWLAGRPIAEITPSELLAVLRRAECQGKRETARRCRQIAGKIFRYAVASGRAERDPAQDLRDALAPPQSKHLASITDPKRVGPLLLAIDSYRGTPVVCAALRLAPLVFVRPGELRQARWAEFDLDEALWSIPAERMKMRQAHLVPLSTQAVGILRELKVHTGKFEFVFPSARSPRRPMSNNAVNAALRCMGIDHETMCGHGFRAMARTLLDELLNYRVDVIEHQLAHAVHDPNGRAYNRTTHLEARKEMMQGWADFLDRLRASSESSLRAA